MNTGKVYCMDAGFDGLCLELGHISLHKKKEYLCGDFFQIAENETDRVLVLSDGLGSGVKANILSTLTATMLCNMIANRIPIEEAVRSVAKTLPICSVRKLAYATFTVLAIQNNQAVLYQFDSPDLILLRNGKPYDYPVSQIQVDDKLLLQSRFELRENDVIIMMSDGITNAGMGKTTNGGWGQEDVRLFCEKQLKPGDTPTEIAARLAEAGFALDLEETDDDITAVVMRVRKKQIVNLMIGPPRKAEDDDEYFHKFLESEGKHVICGGTTARIAARFLGREVEVLQDTVQSDLPAQLRIRGMDLVTEGFLTLERLLEYCEDWQEDALTYRMIRRKKDGAAQLFKILFDEATEIHLFFGNARNKGNENSRLTPERKNTIVSKLMIHLRSAGKDIKVMFWEL